MAVIAIIALLGPVGGATLYRIRQIEIKVMNGLSDDMSEVKTELKAVQGELARLRILIVSQIENRG